MLPSDGLTSEFAYIAWVRQRVPSHSRVALGIGDDAAVLHWPSGRDLLITTDMILEGVHFDLSRARPALVGRKALAVNLSDIAAMAGVPVAAVVALGMPRDFAREMAEGLHEGIRSLAEEFGVAVVGGDTNASRSGLVVSITVVGEATALGAVPRSGARPGDWIMVTGSLGGSILGKHLEFTPRVREALVLHERYELRAMIDVTDGLAADLGHILAESGVGGILRASAIPISDAARSMAGTSNPLERALQDGEDFELLFTLPPDEGERLLAERPIDLALSPIGVVTPGRELLLEQADGSRHSLLPRGYDHFRR